MARSIDEDWTKTAERSRKIHDSDWTTTAERIEEILYCLTQCKVSRIGSVDRGAAARAIAYCRGRAAGAEEDIDREVEMVEFLAAHKQSIDWVFLGRVGVMIAGLAEGTHSPRRKNGRPQGATKWGLRRLEELDVHRNAVENDNPGISDRKLAAEIKERYPQYKRDSVDVIRQRLKHALGLGRRVE
jgi:hypothetical protein